MEIKRNRTHKIKVNKHSHYVPTLFLLIYFFIFFILFICLFGLQFFLLLFFWSLLLYANLLPAIMKQTMKLLPYLKCLFAASLEANTQINSFGATIFNHTSKCAINFNWRQFLFLGKQS